MLCWKVAWTMGICEVLAGTPCSLKVSSGTACKNVDEVFGLVPSKLHFENKVWNAVWLYIADR